MNSHKENRNIAKTVVDMHKRHTETNKQVPEVNRCMYLRNKHRMIRSWEEGKEKGG